MIIVIFVECMDANAYVCVRMHFGCTLNACSFALLAFIRLYASWFIVLPLVNKPREEGERRRRSTKTLDTVFLSPAC